MATRALHSDPTLGERSWLTTSNCPIFRSTAVIPSEAAQSPWQSKVGVLDPGCFCPRQGLSSEQYLLGSREREPLLTGEQYLLGSREREPGVGKGGPVGLGKTFSESYLVWDSSCAILLSLLPQVSELHPLWKFAPSLSVPISPLPFRGISPNKSLVPNPVLEFASQKTWTGVFSSKTLCFFIFRALTSIFNCIMFNCSTYLII